MYLRIALMTPDASRCRVPRDIYGRRHRHALQQRPQWSEVRFCAKIMGKKQWNLDWETLERFRTDIFVYFNRTFPNMLPVWVTADWFWLCLGDFGINATMVSQTGKAPQNNNITLNELAIRKSKNHQDVKFTWKCPMMWRRDCTYV